MRTPPTPAAPDAPAAAAAAGHRMILASSSPSRRLVLRRAGVDPEVIAPEVDEEAVRDRLGAAAPAEVVRALAAAKSTAVRRRLAAAPRAGVDVIIACDSMLLLDGALSGKPHTAAECARRWRAQAGRAAELLTGHAVTVLRDGAVLGEHAETVATTVRFGTPAESDIAAYAATGEPLGCAGAFTLEALGGWFIDGVDGDPASVLGLSLPLLRRILAGHGLGVASFWNLAGPSGAAG